MMDEALKNHKESAFGWVWALREIWSALRAPSPPCKRRRLLTPR